MRWLGGMAGPRRLLSVAWVLVCLAVGTEALAGDVLLESRFVRDVEGWSIGIEGKGEAAGPLEHDRGMKRVKGGDSGDVSWYFVAPEKVGFGLSWSSCESGVDSLLSFVFTE